ncbi:hypothetical protein A9G24_10065 [Gilliamella sp. App6-5]|jgi:hypothetical protein|nr:hypothetical protein A9G24_10065 [Gilliamella apicola]
MLSSSYNHERDGKNYFYPFVWVSDFHPDVHNSQGWVFKYSYDVYLFFSIGQIFHYIDLDRPDTGRGFGAICVTP